MSEMTMSFFGTFCDAELENWSIATSWIAPIIGELFAFADDRLFFKASLPGCRKLSTQRMRARCGLSVHSLNPVPLPGLHFENRERLRPPAMSRTRMSNL